MHLTERAALTGAVDILRDLHTDTPCNFNVAGDCTAHGWTGRAACPQFRIRQLLKQLDTQAPEPPYTGPALDAMLRGCTQYQQVHVRFAVNGYTHRGRLGRHTDISTGRRFYVDTAHGDRVERLRALDILEADVCAHDLRGVPLDPRHDPH